MWTVSFLVSVFTFALTVVFFRPEYQQYVWAQFIVWNFNFWQGTEHCIFAHLYCKIALDSDYKRGDCISTVLKYVTNRIFIYVFLIVYGVMLIVVCGI